MISKRLLPVILCTALAPLMAQVKQTAPLVVESGHKSFITQPGVTAAYSMNTDTVQASAVPGGVEIIGKSPGQTTVVLVTVTGVRTLTVTVPPQKGAAVGGDEFSLAKQTVEFGQYEIRYNNSPSQITSSENVTQIAGTRQIHVQIVNANIFANQGSAPVGFPLLSYEISHPGQRITLVDLMMNNSNLTMAGVLLRGFHLQQGKWEFHAGITSMTEFQDFLLPSSRYEVAGASRHFKLSKRAALEANAYYFRTNTAINTSATPGGIATLYYQYLGGRHMEATAELGVGNGVAVSGKLTRDTGNRQIHADFQYESPHIASLSLNELHGRVANFSFQQMLKHQSQVQVNATDTDINLPTEKQQIDTLGVNQMFRVNKHVRLIGGLTASRFVSKHPVAPTIGSAGFIVGPELDWKHFGTSFAWQTLRNSGNNPSSTTYQAGAHTVVKHFSGSVFFNTQTQTPVFAPVQSGIESLRETLQHESALATSPAQMVSFMHETASLATQGYIAPLTVGVVSRREQYGTNLDWTGEKTGHISFNGLVNSSTGGELPSVRLVSGGLIWTRRFGTKNLLNAGFSLFKSTSGNQSSMQPVEQFSFQHQLNSAPRFLVPGRRGSIDGHVFVDDKFVQSYAKGDTPLADVLVQLDGRRSTHTDKNGYFTFHGVPYGVHLVEADYKDTRPFYMTSSSPKSVQTGSSADFGVSFAQGHVFGVFRNDAGEGMQVTLTLSGKGIERELNTTGDGSVEVEGLPDGEYVVRPVASTLPPGYSLADLEDKKVQVTARKAGHFEFLLQAQRSISGTIELYDPVAGQNIPLANAVVSLSPVNKTATTDSRGRYLFRRLAPGDVTVSCEYQGKQYTRAVVLASTPDTETGVNIKITLSGLATTPPPAPSLGNGSTSEPAPAPFQNQMHFPRRRRR